jgi:transposase
MKDNTNSFLNSLWSMTTDLCHEAQIPLYRERNDPKVFTTVQKIYLYFYKIKRKFTLRDLVEDLKDSNVVKYLGLSRIPNFSTLSYFLKTLPGRLVLLLKKAVDEIIPKSTKVIVDSTGFECTYPSHYYCFRRDKQVDGFLTLHALVDQEHGYFREFIITEKKHHDSTMLKPLVEGLSDVKIEIVYGDRGYDSEKNYRYLLLEKDCLPLILQKNMLKPVERCSGELRLEIREVFDYGEYLKRNKIEAIFSALKRKYSSSLRSRNVESQRKELYLKVILFNMEKKITEVILIFFSRITFQQNHEITKK